MHCSLENNGVSLEHMQEPHGGIGMAAAASALHTRNHTQGACQPCASLVIKTRAWVSCCTSK